MNPPTFRSLQMKSFVYEILTSDTPKYPSSSLDAFKTSELMFHVYTDPSPCPKFLSRTSVCELVATCSDFLGLGRPSASEVVQCACSKLPVHMVATAGYQNGPGFG